MRFGFIIPHNWGLDDPDQVVQVATAAEELGFDSVWVNHHVLHAGFILDRLGDQPYYDSLTVLTYVAALTSRVRLGTSVLVLPYFNPIVLAKSLASLDVLSRGRLIVGVGVGGLPHESEALGAEYARRGAFSDEAIAIMRTLWTETDPSHAGEFYSFSGVKFSPKPVQRPHPPVWIGGLSRAALRRVARLGDGWHPNVLAPDELRPPLDYLRRQLDAVSRTMSDIAVSVRCELDVLDGANGDSGRPMVGTAGQLLEAIEAYAGLGVEEMVLSVSTADVGRIRRVMESFADRVMSRARG